MTTFTVATSHPHPYTNKQIQNTKRNTKTKTNTHTKKITMIANENDETNERVTPTSVRECSVTRRHEKNAETDGTVTSSSFTTSTATKTGGNVTSSTATSTGASFTGTIASSTASSTASSLVEDVENVINNVSLPIDTTTTTATSLVTTTSSTESTTTTGSSSVTTTTSSTGSTVNYDKDYLQKVGLQFVNGSSNQKIGFCSTFEIETLLNLTGDANEAITREQKTKLENDDEIKNDRVARLAIRIDSI